MQNGPKERSRSPPIRKTRTFRLKSFGIQGSPYVANSYFACLRFFLVLCFFAFLESGLYWGGYGYPTDFYIGNKDRGKLGTNPGSGWRFFSASPAGSPIPSYTSEKPAGTIRIFILGGISSAGCPESGIWLRPHPEDPAAATPSVPIFRSSQRRQDSDQFPCNPENCRGLCCPSAGSLLSSI